VALLLVFVLLGCLALRQASSGDVGFHLAAGEYVLDGNGWPRTDPFTYTVADHDYVDTTWGYQVLLALLERALGAPGLVLFHAGLVLAALGLVYRTARLGPADPTTLLLLLFLGGLAGEMRYEVRPEVLSYTLLAWVLYLTLRHAEGLRSPLWLLPPTFLLWVNSHSLFVLGWIALACVGLGLLIRDHRPDWKLIGWSAASVAVAIVNPYGWRAVLFPLTLATRFEQANVFNQAIGEFKSPFGLGLSEQFPFYPRWPIFSFRILFVLAVLSLIPLIRHKRWCSVLLWIPFAYLSLSMIRNIPLLVIACLPGVAWGIRPERVAAALRIPAPWHRTLLRVATGGVVLASLVLTLRVYNDAYYIANRRPERFGTGWNRLTLPVDAAAYAGRAALEGRVLNHLNFGGFLMWARDRPVFIDGRLEVMGEEFFDEYRRILGDEQLLEAAVSRYGIQWIVFPYRIAPRLLGRLSGDPRWVVTYVDPLAVVFVRADRIDPLQVDPVVSRLLRRAGPPSVATLPGLGGGPRRRRTARWMEGLVQRESFPTEAFYLGLFHYWRGETERAASRFAEALGSSRGAYYEVYLNLGSALYRLGRFAEARDCYRVVLEEAPSNRLARQRLNDIERRFSVAK
jgi:tetratricopeptide (TPR) repeat protein